MKNLFSLKKKSKIKKNNLDVRKGNQSASSVLKAVLKVSPVSVESHRVTH